MRTFGAAGAVEGDLIGGGRGGGHPVLLAQLAQAVGPVRGEAVGHHIGVRDPGSLQRLAHLCLGPEHQRRAGLTCAHMRQHPLRTDENLTAIFQVIK